MPEMNGAQLAAAIKSQEPGTPVILLTGFGEEMQAKGALPADIDLVLGKPVCAADLRNAVFTAMSQSNGAEEVEKAAPPVPRQRVAEMSVS